MKRMLLFSALLTAFVASSPAVEIEDFTFDDDVRYDIVYRVSTYETETVQRVNLEGVEVIAERLFLVFRGTTFGGKEKGFVLLDSVLSIIPEGVTRERVKPPQPHEYEER